jgi:hypothetical protein
MDARPLARVNEDVMEMLSLDLQQAGITPALGGDVVMKVLDKRVLPDPQEMAIIDLAVVPNDGTVITKVQQPYWANPDDVPSHSNDLQQFPSWRILIYVNTCITLV